MFATIAIALIASVAGTQGTFAPNLQIPKVSAPFTIDGKLDEPAYRSHPPLEAFVAAGNPSAKVQFTKAWLFWSADSLVFAFEVDDSTPAGAGSGPMKDEHVVDGEDRVEMFLWSGKPEDAYYCIEVACQGHVHDYKAHFYRKFDDGWLPAGLKCRVTTTSTGYVVEASLPRTAIVAMGQRLEAGRTFRLGLFRADFRKLNGDPTWITWADRKGDPDFHVAESFGTGVLANGQAAQSEPALDVSQILGGKHWVTAKSKDIPALERGFKRLAASPLLKLRTSFISYLLKARRQPGDLSDLAERTERSYDIGVFNRLRFAKSMKKVAKQWFGPDFVFTRKQPWKLVGRQYKLQVYDGALLINPAFFDGFDEFDALRKLEPGGK